MKKLRSHFRFNKQERSGIFFLLLAIILLQVAYLVIRSNANIDHEEAFSVDQSTQTQINTLKQNLKKGDTLKLYPFNPNFITDYKGYTLGMSAEQIDRLHTFRAQNKFVNSEKEFQEVTKVSDSLLSTIAPYFKFPEWAKKRAQTSERAASIGTSAEVRRTSKRVSNSLQDINSATAEDLRTIYGVGNKLSARIVKFRNRLGGFLIDGQLYDVYGLEPEVVERVLAKFRVLKKPNVQKININTASAEDLSKLIYIQGHIAERIVAYRSLNGSFDSFDDLANIEDFPVDKIDRIALYLIL